MLAHDGKLAHGHRALGVHGVAAASPRRSGGGGGDVVGLVNDERVEGIGPRRVGGTRLGVHLVEHALGAGHREPVHAHDDTRVQAEWVGSETEGPAGFRYGRRVHNLELQAKLLAHLVLPLHAKRRGTGDYDRAGTVTQQQLLEHQAGLDGLTQANVVGKQQVRARSRKGAAQRLQLVRLEVGPRTEGRLKRAVVGVGHGAPAHGVHKGPQGVGVVEPLWVDRLGQPLFLDDKASHLELPDNGKLLAHAVLGQGLQ